MNAALDLTAKDAEWWKRRVVGRWNDDPCGCTPPNLDAIARYDYDFDRWHASTGCPNAIEAQS